MYTKDLGHGFEIREMTSEEFWPLWDKYADGIFQENSMDFMWRQHISDEEKAQLKDLGKNMGSPLRIMLGVFKNGQFAGWSVGDQYSADVYYMRNSAILPEYRRNGLYTQLMTAKLELLTQKGFQRIYSRHVSTNNPILIAKLKAGFIITALELDDMFGTLVHLSYLTNPLRRKVMSFRSGEQKPDEQMKPLLNLD